MVLGGSAGEWVWRGGGVWHPIDGVRLRATRNLDWCTRYIDTWRGERGIPASPWRWGAAGEERREGGLKRHPDSRRLPRLASAGGPMGRAFQ